MFLSVLNFIIPAFTKKIMGRGRWKVPAQVEDVRKSSMPDRAI